MRKKEELEKPGEEQQEAQDEHDMMMMDIADDDSNATPADGAPTKPEKGNPRPRGRPPGPTLGQIMFPDAPTRQEEEDLEDLEWEEGDEDECEEISRGPSNHDGAAAAFWPQSGHEACRRFYRQSQSCM